jgi:hypothetical protein
MPEVRALHVHSGNLMGGVETALTTLAAEREAVPGLEQHFALAFHGELADGLAATGAPVWHLGAVRTSRPWTVRRGRRTLRSLIAEIEPGVVICHAPWAQAIFGPTARLAGRPVVFWQHGTWSSGSTAPSTGSTGWSAGRGAHRRTSLSATAGSRPAPCHTSIPASDQSCCTTRSHPRRAESDPVPTCAARSGPTPQPKSSSR